MDLSLQAEELTQQKEKKCWYFSSNLRRKSLAASSGHSFEGCISLRYMVSLLLGQLLALTSDQSCLEFGMSDGIFISGSSLEQGFSSELT